MASRVAPSPSGAAHHEIQLSAMSTRLAPLPTPVVPPLLNDLTTLRLCSWEQLADRVQALGDGHGYVNVLDPNSVKLCMSRGRTIGGLLSILSSIFNLFAVIYTASTLPKRKTADEFNLTRYFLAFFEASAIGLMLLAFMCTFLARQNYYRADFTELPPEMRGIKARSWAFLQSALSIILSFNCLTLVAALRPGVIVMAFSVHLMLGVIFLMFAGIGAAPLVLKMSQVAFVGTTNWAIWSGTEWIALLGFINNIASLTNSDPDHRREMLQTLALPLLQSETGFDHLELRLMTLLMHFHGWKGWVWYYAMTAHEASMLLMRDMRFEDGPFPEIIQVSTHKHPLKKIEGNGLGVHPCDQCQVTCRGVFYHCEKCSFPLRYTLHLRCTVSNLAANEVQS